MRAIGLAASLTAFWIFLSGYWLPLILSFGVLSIALCVYIARQLGINDEEGYPSHLLPKALFSYWPWLVKEIVVSNFMVAKAILRGGDAIHPQVLTVKASQPDELGQTVYANSITLTPGTVAIAVQDDVITVHALMDETAEGLLTDDMNKRVCAFMGYAPTGPSTPIKETSSS
ncbi:Na+/H+ antiporter subunit E [Rhodospirillales bacterium]|nr:Na+/H+ antiporter subunit E [Rhodospirillales bacterium]